MTTGIAPQHPSLFVGEKRSIAVYCHKDLDERETETIAGTPTFAQYKKNNATGAWDVSTDLTINSIAVNASAMIDPDEPTRDVRAGTVITAMVRGAVANTTYRVVWTLATSKGQEPVEIIELSGLAVA